MGGVEAQLSAFNTVIKNVATNHRNMIFENIPSVLGGGAYQAVRYREFMDWETLKNHLRAVFGATYSINYLQSQLSNI